MTENKRYTLEWESEEICQVADNGNYMGTDEVVNRLNELHEENQMLKEEYADDCNEANSLTVKIAELTEENEQLKKDIRELQNDKLLTELQMKCDKKQEHILVLENKIRRMRGAIHKLEWLASHRNADLKRENEQLKREINMLKTTISRNEAYIQQIKHKGEWK